MAWGARQMGIDDLLERIASHDPGFKSLTLMRQRKLDGVQDVARLCAALKDNMHLTELSISAHAISPEAAEYFARLLAQPNSVIQSISLGNSEFGDQGMHALAPGISASPSLTHLDAERKGLGSGSMTSLSSALASSSTLRTLNLSHNPSIGDEGVLLLCSSPWTCLRELDLQACNLGAQALAALVACPGLPHLVNLSCAFNPSLSSDASPALRQLFTSARKLVKLNLAHTSVGDAGVDSWVSTIQQGITPTALTHLDLSHIGMSAAGGHALSKALAAPTCRLTHLLLEGNPLLDDTAVCAISEAVCNRHTQDPSAAPSMLSHLDLSRAGISPAALAPLSRIPTLRSLSLLGCQLGGHEGSSSQITAALPAFSALQELILSGCDLSLAALQALLSTLASGACPALVCLEVGGNPGCADDAFHAQVQELRGSRPGLQVHWRSSDQQHAA